MKKFSFFFLFLSVIFMNTHGSTLASANDQRTVQKLECIEDANTGTGGHGYIKQVSLIRNKVGKYDVFYWMREFEMGYSASKEPKLLAKDLDCKFSKNDLRVVECQRVEEDPSPSPMSVSFNVSQFSAIKRVDTEVDFHSKKLQDATTTALVITIRSRLVDPAMSSLEIRFPLTRLSHSGAVHFSKCEVVF